MDEIPDHSFSPGCCGAERAEHPWSEKESREVAEWMNTEPGMIQRLENRKAALRRMQDLGAPEVILGYQRKLVRDMEERLGIEDA